MNPDRDSDSASPAEEQLLRHLHALRDHPPEPDSALAAAVIQGARWQRAVRPFAVAAGRLVAAIGDSARIIGTRVEA